MSGSGQSTVLADGTWDHEVALYVGGTTPFYHTIVPVTGVLQIRLLDPGGGISYWNGSAWVAGVTTLATTIVGNRSRYPFTVPISAAGKAIHFRGWIVRNGKPTPPEEYTLNVAPTGSSGGGGGGSGPDIEEGGSFEPRP